MPSGNFGITPEDLQPRHVMDLPLHEVTESYGTLGLMLRFEGVLERTGLAEVQEVQEATQFALMLHSNDTRTNGHYADHILRVPLRIIEYYGITDPAIIAAAVMHDGVEDHAKEIVYILAKENIEDEAAARERSFELLPGLISDEATGLVRDVTNPILLPGQNKLEVYSAHVWEMIKRSPKGRVIKLSDFTDNAVGNHYTHGEKQIQLDFKYLDSYHMHEAGLYLPDSLITGETRIRVARQLSQGHARSLARLAMNELQQPGS